MSNKMVTSSPTLSVSTPPTAVVPETQEAEAASQTSLAEAAVEDARPGSPSANATDSQAWDSTPLVQEKPTFPYEARENGIEGWVRLRFDVKEDGHPMNLQILESNPRGYFEYEAKKNIRKRIYKPFLLNGVPTIKVGIEVKLVFSLKDP